MYDTMTFVSLRCDCGKVLTYSEQDARKQYEFEERSRGRTPYAREMHFYQCAEVGTWHWARQGMVNEKERTKYAFKKCQCEEGIQKFRYREEAEVYLKTRADVPGMVKRPYLCDTSGTWHVEYALKWTANDICQCRRASYNTGKGDTKHFKAKLKSYMSPAVLSNIKFPQCKYGNHHPTSTFPKMKGQTR